MGEEFALGNDRAGTVERLTEIGNDLGFRVVAVPRLTNGTEVVSSSRVRAAVMSGDVATARRLLGRPFRVAGEVVHGHHLGRTIGFPTANVAPPPGVAPLADGIYAAWARLPGDETPRPAVAYIGSRPTVNGGERMVETHLLDFDGDLYGQTIDHRLRRSASAPTSASTPSTTSSPRCGSTRRRRGRSWRVTGQRGSRAIRFRSTPVSREARHGALKIHPNVPDRNHQRRPAPRRRRARGSPRHRRAG